VYLAYIDDSAGTDTRSRFAVFAGVIIPDTDFFWMRAPMAISPISSYEEFHARDLFKGTGDFADLSEEVRLGSIDGILNLATQFGIKVVYGAVDRVAVAKTLFATVQPADVAFRACLTGINDWVAKNQKTEGVIKTEDDRQTRELLESLGVDNDLCVVFVDDTGDIKLKERLKETYRYLRPHNNQGQLRHLHDAIYFGDSKDSVGIQMADMAAYFIGLHLSNQNEGEAFYRKLESVIVYSEIFPETDK